VLGNAEAATMEHSLAGQGSGPKVTQKEKEVIIQ
jgi:hypothetical protein